VTAVPSDERCSVRSERVLEPVHATAPLARAWLVLEQSGPYGREALLSSGLPDAVGAALTAASEGTRTKVLLARPVGRAVPEPLPDTGRRFWFAHCAPGGVRMRTGIIDDDVLLRPDLPAVLDAAARGELPPWGARTDEPLMLVCTNAKRDQCCALVGRPLAEALDAGPFSGRVLESQHLGGHRFAPTALLLPSGHVFGRLDAPTAESVLSEALQGRLAGLDHLRGRSAAAAPAQAAAIAVRRAEGVHGLDDIDVLRRVGEHAVPVPLEWDGDGGAAELEVRHVDGRAWHVPVRRTEDAAQRPESCGKPALPVVSWLASTPVPAPRWN